MSFDKAVAAVTLGIKHTLQSALNQSSELGAEVRTEKPDRMSDTTAPTVNVYLYQASINPFMRDDDILPLVRPAPGNKTATLVQTWQVPLRLHYLISFYGDESALVPQRLMAVCVAALHRHPNIPAERAATLAAALGPDDGQAPPPFRDVSLSFTGMSTDDIFRLWSSFKASYALSVAYEATTVIVASAPADSQSWLVQEPVVAVEPLQK